MNKEKEKYKLRCPKCQSRNTYIRFIYDSEKRIYRCRMCGYVILEKNIYERDLFFIEDEPYSDEEGKKGFLVYGNRP